MWRRDGNSLAAAVTASSHGKQKVNDFYKNQVPTLQGVNYRIAPYHVLWPVPISAQRFNVNGRINQNKGYAGFEANVPALDKLP